MKVLFDHQCFVNQEYGGISRYFVEMWKEFEILGQLEFDTTITFSNNVYLDEIPKIGHHTFFKGQQFRGKRFLMNKLNFANYYIKFMQSNFDIFHATYFDPYFIDLIGRRPYIITFYDAIYLLFGDKYRALKDDGIVEHQRKVLNNASAVLAISEHTKSDLIDYYGIPESKVFVTHLSCSQFDLDAAQMHSMTIPENYILYVGNRDLYKNFTFFVESIKDILTQKDIRLVCAGGGRFVDEELIFFEKLQIKDKVIFYKIDNTSLPKLYMNALLFVFPSLYEGFGIPILEAMYCGCPVAASNVSSLPEIGGNACSYFDPNNKDSIFNSINKIVSDTVYKESLIKLGQSQIQKFSWKNTALQTINAYRTVLGS